MDDVQTVDGCRTQIVEQIEEISAEATALSDLLRRLFVERRDVKAWQRAHGGYVPDRTEMTGADLHAHLLGRRTLGHYLLSPEDKCRILAFDVDLTETGVWDGDQILPRDEFARADTPTARGLRARC